MAAPLLAATRVLFISRTAERAALEVFPRLAQRSVVVLNGVPDRPVPPVPAPASPPVRLAVVSRLSERKSQHVAIEAVDHLRRAGHEVHLELAGTVYPGNEAYEERLRTEVLERGLTDHVTFSGYVSPSSAVFDRCHVALSLSVRDALGNVVVEAQLAERPVIATAAGGHLESIVDGSTGLHVPSNDAEAVAAAVTRLVGDPRRGPGDGAGRAGVRPHDLRRGALRRARRRHARPAHPLTPSRPTRRARTRRLGHRTWVRPAAPCNQGAAGRGHGVTAAADRPRGRRGGRPPGRWSPSPTRSRRTRPTRPSAALPCCRCARAARPSARWLPSTP